MCIIITTQVGKATGNGFAVKGETRLCIDIM